MVKRLPILSMLLVVLVVFLMSGCPCEPKPSQSLAVTLHPQETGMWCWAASGQMVMHYLGHNVSQCTQANNEFGRTDCCHSPVPGGCVQGGWPEFAKYNFDAKHTSDTALTWDQLRKQISSGSNCGNKPFCFTWHWNGGGGHMMVAIGYQTVGATNWVERNNPWPPNVGDHDWITYAEYVSGADHTHWDDYYDITYKGAK
jgi:Papain-like cysteine protease AvrRpt2